MGRVGGLHQRGLRHHLTGGRYDLHWHRALAHQIRIGRDHGARIQASRAQEVTRQRGCQGTQICH